MRLVLAASLLTAVLAGCSPRVTCEGASCNPLGTDAGLPCGGSCSGFLPVCDVQRNVCITCGGGLGCSGLAPVCDEAAANGSGACVACTPTEGCSGAWPHCLIDARGRRCVECLADSECGNDVCEPVTHRCTPRSALDAGEGGDDAGAGDAGPATDAGVGDAGVGDAGSPDAGPCIVRPPPIACTTECQEGFACNNGQCVLNGGGGPVQVTLRWNTAEDVDLHVLEPVAGGQTCDVYYGNASGSACGAVGVLDLDSNAGCSIDNVDIENVIYPSGAPAPVGTYAVRVDHYENCSAATTVVPYEVEVRVGTNVMGYCGAFVAGGPGWNNGGGANSGTQVMTFTVP